MKAVPEAAGAGVRRIAVPGCRHCIFYAALALTLTVLLYGSALSLPLFSDDLVQIPWLESISWRELWTGPSPYGYYRPLWYSLWRVWGGIFGGLNPPALHALSLVAHFAASALVGTLAATWVRPDGGADESFTAGLVATAVFAAFPFARQAVAWPGAVYNPIVVALSAGAVLSYDRGRARRQGRWIFAASVLCVLAALNYEAGLLAGPLVVIVELVGRLSQRWEERRSWWPLLFVAVFLATFLLWQHMRGAGAAAFGLHASDLSRNLGFVLQGLVYPAAPVAQLFAQSTGISSLISLWLVGLPVAGLLLWAAWRRNRSALLLAVAWLALFALPPVVSMEADWFDLAPRFLYTTAPGVAVAWATTLAPLALRIRTRAHAVLAALVAASLLIPAGIFVCQGLAQYAMAGEVISAAADAATEVHPLLLVNLPMRITPSKRVYPLGFEGITPLPQRVTGANIIYVHTGITGGAETASFGVVATDDPNSYSYQLLGPLLTWQELATAIRRNEMTLLADYQETSIRLLEAGAIADNTEHPGAVAVFGGQVELLTAESDCDREGNLALTATWRVHGSIQTDVTVFAHILNGGGALVAQADGHPFLGMLPFRLWQPGETMRDSRHFGTLHPGQYTLVLGLWEASSGVRWSVADHGGDSVSLTVNCPSSTQ
jgi:hypothetical protein